MVNNDRKYVDQTARIMEAIDKPNYGGFVYRPILINPEQEIQSELAETKISHFHSPIKNILPHSTISISKIHKKIVNDVSLMHNVLKLRKQSKDEQKILKATQLQYFTPSGSFSQRNKDYLIEHSGYLCLDFDDIPQTEIPELKSKLITDKLIPTVLLFTSPTGTGVKWITRIQANAETHGQYFDAVTNYVLATYEIQVDKSGRDVARACFYSHDSDAYLGEPDDTRVLDETFLNKWGNKPKEKDTTQKVNEIEYVDDRLNQVKKLVDELLRTQTDLTSHYQNWVNIGFALCELDEEGRDFFHQISSLHPDYDIDECDDKFSSLLSDYDGSIKLGTLFHLAKENNILVSPPEVKEDTRVKKTLVAEKVIFNTYQTPRTANKRLQDAKDLSPMKHLLGNIWQTGELHILFADTGCGKSVWATQIADSLSKGQDVFRILPNENGPLRVLFYDFELTDTQFFRRYTNENNQVHEFSENLYIDNINISTLMVENPSIKLDVLIINKIKKDIEMLKPDVIVIDNITFLKTETTQESATAMQLIKELKSIKDENNISMLVLAHTPKMKAGTYLSLNELGGSKNLSNFADSLSAIGKSSVGKEVRYIKEIKVRNTELIFDSANIISAQLVKTGSFLGFEYTDLEHESLHVEIPLEMDKDYDKQSKMEIVIRLHEEGMSSRQIAEQVGVSKSTVGVWINSLK